MDTYVNGQQVRLDAEGWKKAGAMAGIPHAWWVPFVSEIGNHYARLDMDDQKGRPTRILELGCGAGNIAYNLAQSDLDIEYYGLDFQQEEIVGVRAMLYRAKADGLLVGGHAIYGDVLSYPFPEVDIVISSGLLEHFEDDQIQHIIDQGYLCGADLQIHMIPNGKCQPYVSWKEQRIADNDWPYGVERTIETLKPFYSDDRYEDAMNPYEYSVSNTFPSPDGEKYLLVSVCGFARVYDQGVKVPRKVAN